MKQERDEKAFEVLKNFNYIRTAIKKKKKKKKKK